MYQSPTFINRELVDRGFAMWCEGGEGDNSTTAQATEEKGEEEMDSTMKESEHEL